MRNEINLTGELSRLLNYTATVATAIGMNTPHNDFYDQKNPEHIKDVMWLAISLQFLGMLGWMIQEAGPEEIDRVCDYIIRVYTKYQESSEDIDGQGDPKGTFERNAGRVRLQDGMCILQDIKTKVRPYLEVEGQG